jgi:hypothetical protein
MTKEENITFFFNEIEKEDETSINQNIIDIDMEDLNNNHLMIPYFVDYQLNYTVKQLLLICDYYDIVKINKLNKCTKDEIIHHLMIFENNSENIEMVLKRKQLWFFMGELKMDKFMKKFILWS